MDNIKIGGGMIPKIKDSSTQTDLELLHYKSYIV